MNDSVDGIMIQLPIPKQLVASDLYALIDDPKNVEKLTFGFEKKSLYQNCLSKSMETMINILRLELSKMKVAVIGMSCQVG